MDLVAVERQREEESLFYSHCKRVWQRLSADQRRAIRQQALATNPDLVNRHSALLDWDCYNAVGNIIRQHGRFFQAATND